MANYEEQIPEITLKFKKHPNQFTAKIQSSKDAFNLLKKFYDQDTIQLCESVIALFLDRSNKSIGWFKVSQGGISSSVIDVRLILITAIKCGASSIMLSHNHPSGDLRPSTSDILITNKLKTGAKTLDITLLNHIIVNDTLDNYFSFADYGRL